MLILLIKCCLSIGDKMVDIFNNYDGKYEILQNDAGDILIVIAYHSGEPLEPKIVYDGGTAILLYRNVESSVFLTDVSNESRQPVLYANKIRVAEIDNDEVIREYIASVHIIKDMRNILN